MEENIFYTSINEKRKKKNSVRFKKKIKTYFLRVGIGWCTEPTKKCWGHQAPKPNERCGHAQHLGSGWRRACQRY
jgi:hypothetical protein